MFFAGLLLAAGMVSIRPLYSIVRLIIGVIVKVALITLVAFAVTSNMNGGRDANQKLDRGIDRFKSVVEQINVEQVASASSGIYRWVTTSLRSTAGEACPDAPRQFGARTADNSRRG